MNEPPNAIEHSENRDWLEGQLIQQAQFLAELDLESDRSDITAEQSFAAIPTVYQLRERILRRRERRARALSLASSAIVLLSVVGWSVASFQQETGPAGITPINADGELANLNPVSSRQTSDESGDSNQYQMIARWWEPVTVEWVDGNGRSLGVAGVVAEERTSKLDPAKLSEEELTLIKAFLAESQPDHARNHFTSSLDPAF